MTMKHVVMNYKPDSERAEFVDVKLWKIVNVVIAHNTAILVNPLLVRGPFYATL
jgi:hypothetical protein